MCPVAHLDSLHLQVAVEGCPLLLCVLHSVLVLVILVSLLVQSPQVVFGLLKDFSFEIFYAGLHYLFIIRKRKQ